MQKHWVPLAAALLSAGSFTFMGCDRNDKGAGDTGTTTRPTDTATGMGGTGTADTTTGAGATNGVSGNETRTAITAPGNTPNGVGITTRPASESNGPDFQNRSENSKPPQSGSGSSGEQH